MQTTKIVTLAAAAAVFAAFSSVASAQGVKNPSGGLVGQPPNFATAGTSTDINGASWNVSSKNARNPSGGLVGQAPNFATAGTAPDSAGRTPAAVRNPSGGLVGEPPNFPTPVEPVRVSGTHHKKAHS
jgi:hypothetical protein